MLLSIFVYLFIFLFGLIIGSFLNSVIYRLAKKESFLFSRSYCPHCGHQLQWYDLIPVLSFILLKGKCRYCHQKISWQYPLVELSVGFLFLLIFHFQFPCFVGFFSFNYQFFFLLYYFFISSLLTVIFVYDSRHYIIPDSVVYLAIATVAVWEIIGYLFFHFYSATEILHFFAAALICSFFFFLLWFVSSGRWMGFGDVKLSFFIGLFLGPSRSIVALFFAFFIGAIIGIILIIFRKKGIKSQIPFGPFLVIGTFIGLFFGSNIISWYFNFLLL